MMENSPSQKILRSVFYFAAALVAFGSGVVAQTLSQPAHLQDTENITQNVSRINFLKTPWGAEITPDNVLAEYPRPTLVRNDWLNLNGLWDWKIHDPNKKVPYTQKILVPFPVESSLSGVTQFAEEFTYRRYFTIPDSWGKENRILLHFGAVDWQTVVTVNGEIVGNHSGGYDPFSFDITRFVKIGEQNELVVHVFDPTNHREQPRGKQSMTPSGIWYSPVSGIWQTVWLEPVPQDYIRSIKINADYDTGIVTILPEIDTQQRDVPKDLTVYAEAFDGEESVAKAYGGFGGPLVMRFDKVTLKAWSPDSPHLYQIRVRLLGKENPLDQVGSYFAFRKIEKITDRRGFPRIWLNGKPLFQMGVIDQGYWSDGLYTAPSDAAVRMDIRVAKSLGFNVIRKHLKVEPERWYFWCDRLGILVWQDMPSGENRSLPSQKQFREELQRMIQFLSNHPSIVLWTIFNEGAGQHQVSEYVDLVHQLDPARLVNSTSGWTDIRCGDISASHKFPGPEMPLADSHRASVIGAFGGLTLIPPAENLWTQDTWGFQHVPDTETLLKRYKKMHEELRRMIKQNGLAGAVFHQLTDVESECNGLTTYDRVRLKIPPEEFNRINRETIRQGND